MLGVQDDTEDDVDDDVVVIDIDDGVGGNICKLATPMVFDTPSPPPGISTSFLLGFTAMFLFGSTCRV